MCKCSGNCNCNNETSDIKKYVDAFNPVFSKHKAAIAQVLVKHGFSDFPVNPLAAGVAYKKNPAVAADISEIIFQEYNGFGDGDKTKKQQITSTALDFFGKAAGALGGLFGARAAANAIKNGEVPGTTVVVNNAPAEEKPKAKEEAAKKIFGLTYTQVGIATGVVALILVLLFFSQQKKTAGA